MPNNLIRLVYASRIRGAREAELGADLSDILTVAAPRNQQQGITGLLISHRGWFIQALEGPARAVEATYERISLDRRHTTPKILTKGPAAIRLFEQWSMSAWSLSEADAEIHALLSGLAQFDPLTLPTHEVMALLTAVARVHEAGLTARCAAAGRPAAA